MVKNQENPLEKGTTHSKYSCLENSMDRGVCRLQSMGSQRIGHDWATKTFTFHSSHLEKSKLTRINKQHEKTIRKKLSSRSCCRVILTLCEAVTARTIHFLGPHTEYGLKTKVYSSRNGLCSPLTNNLVEWTTAQDTNRMQGKKSHPSTGLQRPVLQQGCQWTLRACPPSRPSGDTNKEEWPHSARKA